MEKYNKDVSVVIPAYNASKTIIATLNSIVNQTHLGRIKKIIVVNDGSTDNTGEIVNEWKRNSVVETVLINQENRGVSAARNKGMEIAKETKWIAFCDSDDRWLKNKLEIQMKLLDANDDIEFLGAATSTKTLKIGVRKIESLYKATLKDLCIKSFPQPSTVVFRSEIYKEIGGFDEKQRYAEEGNYFMRIAQKYNFYYLPQFVVEYGDGKRGFGVSGLSGNLKGMYEGSVKNLRDMLKEGYIDTMFYKKMRIFHFIKYIRRIIITKISSCLR